MSVANHGAGTWVVRAVAARARCHGPGTRQAAACTRLCRLKPGLQHATELCTSAFVVGCTCVRHCARQSLLLPCARRVALRLIESIIHDLLNEEGRARAKVRTREAEALQTGLYLASSRRWRALLLPLPSPTAFGVHGSCLPGLGDILQQPSVTWATTLPRGVISLTPPYHSRTPCPMQKLFQEAATTLHGY